MSVAHALADAFVIEGGQRLGGTIRAAGNKNGALPILAACLLTDEPVTLANVPRVQTADASKFAPDLRLCSKIRASFLLAGPLLARFGRATMPPPGGDVIGRRRLDPHMHEFASLGAEIELEQ